MRTTITIDDGLLEDAKRNAEALNLTLSALIEAALRERLAKSKSSKKPKFKLVTFGGDGLQPDITWDRVDHLIDDDEVERLGKLER